MRDFDSYKSYFRFAFAREYAYIETCAPFHYDKSSLEKMGGLFASPALKPGDYVLRNIRNPLFITATVIFALALTTLVFYPAFVPALLTVTAEVKRIAFLMTQGAIIGLCVRTLARLNNTQLMAAWKDKHIQPVSIGSIYVTSSLG